MLQQSLRTRRFIAKYIRYLEIFGYVFVTGIAISVIILWVVTTDDLAESSTTYPIKPRELSVTHLREAVVLRVLTSDRADVSVGQPLVALCDDPVWVGRYKVAQQAAALTAEFEELSGNLDLAFSERPLRDALDVVSKQWADIIGQMPRIQVLAPIAGVVELQDDLVGKIIPREKEILKILDFNDLSVAGELRAANVTLARVGQPVKLEILTTYGNGEILRGDLRLRGRWRKTAVQFNSVAEGKVTDIIQAYLSGKPIALKEDTILALSKVTGVEVLGKLRAQQGAGNGKNLMPEPFDHIEVKGRVVEGTHLASVRIRDLPENLRVEIEGAILDRFGDRSLFVDGSPISLTEISDLKVIVEMSAEAKTTPIFPGDSGTAMSGERLTRTFKFTTSIVDPHPELIDKVRELALASPPTYIRARLKVVVGSRRIVMMLFRKN